MFNFFTMFQVSGRLSELKTTIDAGLGQRNILLQTIGDKFELWNLKVLSYVDQCWGVLTYYFHSIQDDVNYLFTLCRYAKRKLSIIH